MSQKVPSFTPDKSIGKSIYESPSIKIFEMEIECAVLDGSGTATTRVFGSSDDSEW